MSPKKKNGTGAAPPEGGARPPMPGLRPLGGAALATLIWCGLILMKVPDLFGVVGWDGLLPSAIAGLIIGFTPWRRLLWVGAGLTMVAILVIGYTPLFDAAIKDWPRRDPEPKGPADAVLVFSGSVSADGHIGAESVDRLLNGLALAQRWRRPLVVSTLGLKGHPGVTSTLDQNRIIGLVGDSLELYRTDSVHSTYDEVRAMGRLAQEHGWHSIAVVSSPLHSRRACATVTHAGFTVICLPAESRSYSLATLHDPGDRLPAFGDWVYERLGWIKYAWKGWL